MKILPYFDYKLAFKKNMEILKGLHVPIKEEIKPILTNFSVHHPSGEVVIEPNIVVGMMLGASLIQEEELPFIDSEEFEEDFEFEEENPLVLLDNEIEDPDLIEARRLHEL